MYGDSVIVGLDERSMKDLKFKEKEIETGCQFLSGASDWKFYDMYKLAADSIQNPSLRREACDKIADMYGIERERYILFEVSYKGGENDGEVFAYAIQSVDPYYKWSFGDFLQGVDKYGQRRKFDRPHFGDRMSCKPFEPVTCFNGDYYFGLKERPEYNLRRIEPSDGVVD